MPATPAWLAAFEAALNRSIARSIRAGAAAGRLNRTSLQVEIDGVGRIRAAVEADKLALMSGGAADADATIGGPPLALLDLLRGGTRSSTGAKGDSRAAVRISGDAEIAARYRELFALARPDWEEELSRLVGDLPARRLSLLAQSTLALVQRVGRTARANIAEYLTEESRDLVSRSELEEFLSGVDQARETADRIEARLARVEQRQKGPA